LILEEDVLSAFVVVFVVKGFCGSLVYICVPDG